MSVLSVEEILGTYDLDPRTRAIVRRTVTPTLANLRYTTNFALYRGIANLLEQLEVPSEERSSLRITPEYAISEDKVIGPSSKKNKPEPLAEINQKQAFSFLSELHTNMGSEELEKLIDALRINFSSDAPNKEEIESRIKKLIELFSYKGRVIIPNRPIISVSLNPFKIKYTRRTYPSGGLAFFRANQDRYKGLTRADLSRIDPGLEKKLRNEGTLEEAIPEVARREYPNGPLAFFRANQDRYKGLTRTGLYREDNGLYQVLTRAGQMDLAIPKVLTPKEVTGLSEEEVKKVVDLFRESSSATEVSKQTGYRPETIAKYAREHGLNVRKWGDSPNHITEVKRNEIRLRIRTTKDSNYRIAKDLKVATITVKRIRSKLTGDETS